MRRLLSATVAAAIAGTALLLGAAPASADVRIAYFDRWDQCETVRKLYEVVNPWYDYRCAEDFSGPYPNKFVLLRIT
ncbi:hypothetical protein O4J56_30435 [Nocardiopsis sp. RSe5-2]|uniref:Uncharacterized protein n=1 Tax=Nocardiopsis endophytica TaxID=3018445 RepID=A0ABT4UDP6_9ACTN|nr:hypothetical protein [Nocardiopsis endophytica]MDA2815002.1 hypothetical protein [Nocardiopsis endophytica]